MCRTVLVTRGNHKAAPRQEESGDKSPHSKGGRHTECASTFASRREFLAAQAMAEIAQRFAFPAMLLEVAQHGCERGDKLLQRHTVAIEKAQPIAHAAAAEMDGIAAGGAATMPMSAL